jgi:hypothetical protein
LEGAPSRRRHPDLTSKAGGDDDDLNNWTVWLLRPELPAWMADYIVEKWLPEGVEPSWATHE